MRAPASLLYSVVGRLIDDAKAPAKLLAMGDEVAILAMPDETLAALFTVDFGEPDAIGARLRAIVEDNPGLALKLVLLGGEASLREQLPRAGGLLSRRVVQQFHLLREGRGDATWSLWTGGGARRDSLMGRILEQAGRGALPAVAPAVLAARVDRPAPLSKEERADLSERRAFIAGMRVTPWVTWSLLAVLVVIFGLEELWGGSEAIPTLVRMGAGTQDSLAGQPWRLLSSPLLHAGLLHVGLNGYALLMLGGFFEKVLGGPRYGALLAVSALGGSLTSALVSGPVVSVGASGAICGVLGAAAALAWRPGDLLPEAVSRALRRTAMINLGIMTVISLLPQVDLWAHLGGAVVGAGLVLSRVIVRGRRLPGVGKAADDETPADPLRRRFAIAAGLAGLVFAGALGMAWVHGRPWQLRGGQSVVTHALVSGVTVDVPAALGAPRVTTGKYGETMWDFGEPLEDPLSLRVEIMQGTLDADAYADRLAALPRLGPPTPEGAEVVEAWHREPDGTHPWPTWRAEYVYPNGVRSTLWIQVRSDLEIRVDGARWPGDEAWSAALLRVYASISTPPGLRPSRGR